MNVTSPTYIETVFRIMRQKSQGSPSNYTKLR